MRDDDFSDPWGTAMAWGFGVAEVLYSAGEDVPTEMEYVPSPFVTLSNECPAEYPDAEVWGLLDRGEMSIEDVQFAGRCIARYIDWCKAAGLDY